MASTSSNSMTFDLMGDGSSDGSASSFLVLQGPKGVFVIFDYVTSILAVLVNVIVLASVVKARINLTGYKFFLVSLSASNLYLCCINISIFVVEAVRLHGIDSICLGRVFRSLQMSGFIANLLNLSGMSLDHLIGIVYPFAYDRVMRRCTMKIFVALLWTIAMLLGSIELPLTTIFFLSPNNNPGQAASESSSNEETPLMRQLFLESNCTSQFPPPGNMVTSSSLLKSVGNNTLKGSSKIAENNNASATWTQAMTLLQLGIVDDKTLLQMLQQEVEEAERGLTTTTTAANLILRSDTDSKLKRAPAKTTTEEIDNSGYNSCLMKTFLNALGQVASKSGSASKMMRKGQSNSFISKWCDFYYNAPFLEYSIMAMTLICFVFVAYCYGKIFREIFFNTETPKRNVRRLVMTTFFLLSTFAICYLPFMTFELIMVLAMHFDISGGMMMKTSWSNFMVAHNVFNSLLITSPLLQPLLYAGRLSVVRRQLSRDLGHAMSRFCPVLQKPCFTRFHLIATSANGLHSSMSTSYRLPSFSLNNNNKLERYESGARNLCGNRSNNINIHQTQQMLKDF